MSPQHKFEAGKTYITHSIADDHNCLISLTVAKRTDKTITTKDCKIYRVAQFSDDGILPGIEYILPWGRFNMCPIILAVDGERI